MLLPTAAWATVWWVVAGGDPSSWSVGVPAVALAAWATLRLGPAHGLRLSVRGLVAFLPFFLWESLRGGTDVALRTLAPRLRVDPAFVRYRLRLRQGPACTFYANCVSLLPGTLAADLAGDWIEVHALSGTANASAELARLERAVSRVFPDPEGGR
jgi:multicomponent Na+:H+ antiporter subunit E